MTTTDALSVSAKDIAVIKKHLKSRPRDLFLFSLATQTGLPAEHWLELKFSDLTGLDVGDEIPVKEKGRKSVGSRIMTEELKSSFDNYTRENRLKTDDYLLPSRKGKGPLTLSSASRLVKKWFQACDLDISKGLLVLRRIWQDYYCQDIEDNRSREALSDQTPLAPLKIPTRQEAVFKKLEKAILSGQIHPGERIIVEEIAQKLNVSKIPVREALGRLEARGFVYLKPNWGYTVIELSRENLEEILELRINLECLAARKGIPFCIDKDHEKLRFFQDQYIVARKVGDADKLLAMNKEFHFAIYRKAKMPFLQTLIDQLWDRVTPYQHILFKQSMKPNPFVGVQYHEEILLAVKTANINDAVKWLQEDLENSTRFIIDLFDLYYSK